MAVMWRSGISIARSGGLSARKSNDLFVSRVPVKRPGGFSDNGVRLRGQTPDDGLNRLPRLLTASADGVSLIKSAMALASSPSLMGVAGGGHSSTPQPRTNSTSGRGWFFWVWFVWVWRGGGRAG